MKKINTTQLKQLVEAAIFVADKPITKQELKETVLAGFSVADRRAVFLFRDEVFR